MELSPVGRGILFAFILLAMFGLFVPSYSYAEEQNNVRWGFSFSGGLGDALHSKPDMKKYAILPRLGLPLNKDWELEFEGNYSYWAIDHQKDLQFLGVNANFLFKPIRWKKGALFFLAGGGLGYDNSGGKIKQIGDSRFGGILQAGLGAFHKIGNRWILRWEYRLNHISEPFRNDKGLNTHDFLMGISY